MNFLFWNVCKKDVDEELSQLVVNNNIDVLILAEHESDHLRTLKTIDSVRKGYFKVPSIACKRISIYSKFDSRDFKHLNEAERYTIKELRVTGEPPLLLALVHLPSKLYASEDDQLQEAANFKREIESAESEAGHSNTIVLGDFNMNPFEKGMVSAAAFNSVPCLQIAKRGCRTIKGNEHKYFYNPMWSLMGDRDGSPGTFYYNSSSYLSLYWHLLDQVILRPAIAESLDLASLRIVTSTGSKELIGGNGRPNTSDHLPIVFTLKKILENENEELMAGVV